MKNALYPYIRLDENGYIVQTSSEPFEPDQQPVEYPDDFDPDFGAAYRYIDGKFVLDVEKRKSIEAFLADAERRSRLEQNATQRLQAIQAQQAAKAATTADDVIAISPLLPEWTTTVYQVGDVVTYNGVPYKCIQARDCTVHPDWTPVADPAGWANYHATSAEYALPWVQPTGGHDIYKAGEWMIWTDGAAYECVQDTDHSPGALPQAWCKDGTSSSTPDDTEEDTGGEVAPPQWVQPTGAHNAYKKGARVMYNGAVWESDVDGNSWAPGAYGWTKV